MKVPLDEPVCDICEDPVEPSDETYWMGVGYATDEGEVDIQEVRPYHGRCATVADARPPEFNLWDPPSADRPVHAMTVQELDKRRVPVYKSLCGAVEDVPADEIATLRPEGGSFETAVREMVDDHALPCQRCAMSVGGPNPMAEGGIPWRR